ncbi:MAG: PIN domain-containing protein [Actinomycetota bacterium]|nr:PIN domain-containing protein [Actinomycetota bacterium]
MTTYLLDANVLIALTAREHVHHEHVSRWARDVQRFALCPIVEGALIRFVIRLGAGVYEAVQSLHLVRERSGYEFWPDVLSFTDVALQHVRGHRQVTDAYLASLARSRPDAKLATLDEALAQAMPELTLLVPTP